MSKKEKSKNIGPRTSSLISSGPIVTTPDIALDTKTHQKLVAELSVKNKIIYDLTVQENWLRGQIASQKQVQVDPDERARLFSLLERFRSDLESAKEACEQVIFILLIFECI